VDDWYFHRPLYLCKSKGGVQRAVREVRRLFVHSGYRLYFFNTSWLVFEKLARIFAALFIGTWIARHLGAADFGLINYAQSFVGLFIALPTLGLEGVLVRELTKNNTRAETIIGTAVGLRLIGSVALLLALSVAVRFTSNDSDTNVLIFVIAIAPLFQSANVVDCYLQSKVRSKYFALASIAALITSSLCRIWLILLNAPVIAFALMIVLESAILAVVFLYIHYRSNLVFSYWRFDRALAISLLCQSWPLALGGLATMVYMRIDQVMIQAMLGSEAVGRYAAGVQIGEAWLFIPAAIVSSFFPAVVKAKQDSIATFRLRFEKLTTLVFWVTLFIAVCVVFSSRVIINLLYGPAYRESSSILVLITWAGLFSALGFVSARLLLIEGQQKFLLYGACLGAVTNVVLNWAFIPTLGINGAAIATIISLAIASFLMYGFVPQTRYVFYMQIEAIVSPLLFSGRWLKSKYAAKSRHATRRF
jgi:O-antigen/teichoic acid export membrane protein